MIVDVTCSMIRRVNNSDFLILSYLLKGKGGVRLYFLDSSSPLRYHAQMRIWF